MKILKFTDKVQQHVKSKVEPQDYMHIMIRRNGDYAIYVWDTRVILDTCVLSEDAIYELHELDKHEVAVDSNKMLIGDGNHKFASVFTKHRITKESKTIHNTEYVDWFIDGVKVCETQKSSDMYCTVKNGTPSNIRDTRKVTKRTMWNAEGIRLLFGPYAHIPKNDYPDLKWGYTGSLASRKTIQEFIAYVK